MYLLNYKKENNIFSKWYAVSAKLLLIKYLLQQKKAQEFLEIEKHNEALQNQQIELANTSKANKEKVLTIISYRYINFSQNIKSQMLSFNHKFFLKMSVF